MSLLRSVAGLGAVAQFGPALTSVTPLRRVLLPSLSGVSDHPHVALTYDDGPDASTPEFLDLLDRHGVTDVRAGPN